MFLGRTIIGVSAFVVIATAAGAADMAVYRKAPPPEAQPQATGYVELYTGWAETKLADTFCVIGFQCSSFSDKNDGWALGGAGRATYWWAPNASVQLDAQGEGTSYRLSGGASGHFSSHSYLVGGHLNWRDPQRGLFGVFGGAGDATSTFTSSSIRHGLIGLEGQAYWGAVTLYGQVGYDSTLGDVNPGLDSIHAWFVRGTARLYVNPNFRLEGTVLYANGETDFNGAFGPPPSRDFETWLWRAKAEHKFGASPFSIFAAYEGSRTTSDFVTTTFTSTTRITDHRIMGGVRLYLGENTLQWNDNRGTTLDIIAPFSVPSAIFGSGGPS